MADFPPSATSNFSSASPNTRANSGCTTSMAWTLSMRALRCCLKTTPELMCTCSSVTW